MCLLFLMMAQVPKLVLVCLLYPFDHATTVIKVIANAQGVHYAMGKNLPNNKLGSFLRIWLNSF